MRNRRELFVSMIAVICGAALVICAVCGTLDSFWAGIGGGIASVRLWQLLRLWRSRRDPEYRERMRIASSDERNRYIASKAWGAAAQLQMLLAFLAMFVFQLRGEKALMMLSAGSICVVSFAYAVLYLIYNRRM